MIRSSSSIVTTPYCLISSRSGIRRTAIALAVALAVPPVDVAREAVVEEVVARDHDQVLALEPRLLDREAHVADGAEAILVGGRAVVVDIDSAAFRPRARSRLRSARW